MSGLQDTWRRRVAHTKFWQKKKYVKEVDHLEDLSVAGRTILKHVLKKKRRRMGTELIWVRTATNGELL